MRKLKTRTVIWWEDLGGADETKGTCCLDTTILGSVGKRRVQYTIQQNR